MADLFVPPSLQGLGAGVPLGAGGYVTGRYYWGVAPQTATSTFTVSVNTALGAPFLVQTPPPGGSNPTFTKIGTRVTTAATSSHLQFAIYAASNGGISGAPILTTASQSSAAAGIVEVTISQVLAPGPYVLWLISDGTPTISIYTDNASLEFFGTTTDNGFETTPLMSTTFGTWPTNPTVTYAQDGGNHPQIWLRK